MRRRLVVISPHLDDAVLGCSALLARHHDAVVVTVFAGRPPASAPLTPWDEAAGFRAGDDVIGTRRAADRAALEMLRAEPLWLPFPDATYGQSQGIEAIVPALDSALRAAGATSVCIPLGLFHSDHILTHAAGLRLLARYPSWRWLAYEEAMYRRVPGVLDDRLASVKASGITATPLGSV